MTVRSGVLEALAEVIYTFHEDADGPPDRLLRLFLGVREPDDPRLAEKVEEPTDDELEILDIKAGSLVLIHGNVLHKSEKNTSPRSRYAYTFHVIEGADGWEYDKRNWLQPSEGGFSRLSQ